MRILVFNEAPVRLLGGIMTETRMLIAGLQARGHSVALASEAMLSGVNADHFVVSVPRTPHSILQMQAAIDAFKPDIVHVLFAFVGGILGHSRVLRAHPWVLTCHSVPPHEWSAQALHRHDAIHYLARAWSVKRPTIGGFLVYGLRIPPHVIVHSDVIGGHVRSRLFPGSRLTIIPFGYRQREPGYSWPEPRKPGTAPRLLTVAGITHTKGQHDVLSALPLIRERYPDLKYTILGEVRDPTYLEYLKKRIVELNLGANVDFLIDASKAEVEQSLAATDVFLQPSHEEGFCLSFLEAAAQVPLLVGTRTGALSEISETDPGARVVPIGRPKAIASALLDLLTTNLPSAHMLQRDARLARTFAWSKYFDSHESVYDVEVRRDRSRRTA